MINYIKNYLLFILSIGIAFSVNIKGTITDIDTNEPLIGANVYIDGTSKGSATDANGSYFISDVRSCSTCKYTLKVMYIGYEQYEKTIEVFNNEDIITDLKLKTASIQTATTKITAKKRQDKVIDAPAAIELVSASDIKKEESTNLGSYLKGIKGVDFTSSGVNNYSISVRGFNSSFSSRLLTLTDGRIANIPALRVVNYSSIPQSSKDIESIEVALGPSTALYGANAHSGVVNITSKSPANSEGFDLSVSGTVNDDLDLYKISSRWASKINNKLSFKLSNTYLQAYEWPFISEQEYKLHTYPYSGNPIRTSDGKDNNPWGATGLGQGVTELQYQNIDIPSQSVNTMVGYYLNEHPGVDGILNTEDDILFTFSSQEECFDAPGYTCTPISKIIGDGEANNTGDPDGDGFMGEDWFNGYDDDGDGLIDEDYFFADGIDNDGDCPGDTNGDGVICGWGDENVDEDIDWQNDTWIDGYDNNGNGIIDEEAERYDNDREKFNLPEWAFNMEYKDIILTKIKQQEYINGEYNVWYDPTLTPNDVDLGKAHLRGSNIYDEDLRKMLFDVYIYDFGEDGMPGDNAWDDSFGDGNLVPHEGYNQMQVNGTSINVPFESCLEVGETANGICTDEYNSLGQYLAPDLITSDCGLDGICPNNPNWIEADFGEGNGQWDVFDFNYGQITEEECNNINDGVYYPSLQLCGNGIADEGDEWIDGNNDFIFTFNSTDIINDTYPYANGEFDQGEEIYDWGQDGIEGTNDLGEGDGLLIVPDINELDGIYDTGDNCYGCKGEEFHDLDNDGIYNPAVDDFIPQIHDTNGDGVYTPPDYEDNFAIVRDLDGDGLEEYPDFEVKNSKGEFRLDYDPNSDLNITFQSGYSWSKSQQVTGIGRYLTDGYEYTYYQLRGRYKNWFSQIYLNQGNSGDTRGYDLGNRITDTSQNMAFQLQNNFTFKNTKVVWGIDYFRTEAKTNGSVLNDGPNGYDNDGDQWITSNDNIDNDMDSDDYSDWGIDGIGPFLTENNNLVVDDCDDCEPIVSNTIAGAIYDEEYDLYFLDSNQDGEWSTNNPYYPYIQNPNYEGPDFGEGNGIPDGGEIIINNVNIGDATWNEITNTWNFGNNILDGENTVFTPYQYNANENFWYTEINTPNIGDATYNQNNNSFIFNGSYNTGTDNIHGTNDDYWYNTINVNTGEASYNQSNNQWEFEYEYFNNNFINLDTGEIIAGINTGDLTYNNQSGNWESINTAVYNQNENFWYTEINAPNTGDAIFDEITQSWILPHYDSNNNFWYDIVNPNTGDAFYNSSSNTWEFQYAYDESSNYWFEDIDNDNQYDPGEPGVNINGLIYEDGLDNDCDGCDFDNDGIPNFQEEHLGFNIYDPTDYPLNSTLSGPIDALPSDWAYDEMIDEIWCGDIQYSPFVPQNQFTGQRNGRLWECGENFDEEDEYEDVTSNELGFYFQTKTIPYKNDKWEIITAARFDHHDQIDEDVQFSPKFGIFYKPNPFATFRLTYGKAYNTPSAINLYTDIFIGRRGVVEYYLRGNREGTPYTRVGDEFITSIPQVATYETNKLYGVNETELCDTNNDGICDIDEQNANSNWDLNKNSTLEDFEYTLNTFDDDFFVLHNLGGMVNNFPNYWEGIIKDSWFENNDLNNNGIADLNEIDCTDPGIELCPYQKRVEGAPYFLGFNTEFSNVPEFMPLDTALYTVWVPELTDTGRIYTPLESINITDIDPIKTEKIQTIELGFKGFLSERIHVTTDYYMSRYEDFFSAPTVITPLIIERVFEYDENGSRSKDITSMDNLGSIVGMLTVNSNLSNPPYATQWDGRDNDNDWHATNNTTSRFPYLGTAGDIVECPNGESPCYADWYDVFRWDGVEENYNDYNNNGMYDPGEFDITYDTDGNGAWNCVDCAGEWGWILWETESNPSGRVDTLGYNIKFPSSIIDGGEYIINNQEAEGQAVGIDEYDPNTGISEAELIDSPEISALGTVVQKPAYAYTPLHSILAPMNYGEVFMQGLDVGLTFLLPEYKMKADLNFSFYGTTNYYNALTKKNDPINAPKFKLNASLGWDSPFGTIGFKYRHVDRYEWSDGIWRGFIGPYDLVDFLYNYKINNYLEFSLTAMNIFNDVHKEMIGGAKMGRQIIMRFSTSL